MIKIHTYLNGEFLGSHEGMFGFEGHCSLGRCAPMSLGVDSQIAIELVNLPHDVKELHQRPNFNSYPEVGRNAGSMT